MITTTTIKNAARAIEHDLWTDPSTQANYLVKDGAILRRWEPEHNSGDAFDLAADLHFDIMINDCGTEVFGAYLDGSAYQSNVHEDARQATRVAIVLAAAQVGAAL